MTWASLLLLAACGKAPGTDSQTAPHGATPSGTTGAPTGTPSGTTTGTTPTGSTTTGFAPSVYTVAYAWFGVSADQAVALGDVDLFGTPIQTPIQLAVRLGDDTAPLGPTPDNHCDVVLTTYATLDRAAWEGAAGAWFAVELPADAAITGANCDTLDLAAPWDDPEARVALHRWGIAVTALAQADLDALGGTTGSTLAPAWVGGRWWTDAEVGPVGGGLLVGPGVATGNQVDGNGVIARDANHDLLALAADDVAIPGGVADGFYVVTPLAAWRPIPAGFGAATP